MSTDGGSWAPFGPDRDEDERAEEFEPPTPPPATPLAWPPPGAEPDPALRPDPAPPPAPAPPPVHHWPGPPPAPYGSPVRRTSGNATAALVLGIVGIFVCPLVASVPAIALGKSAKREIRENPEMGGHAMATWGVVLGWIGTAFGVLILLLLLAGASVTTRL